MRVQPSNSVELNSYNYRKDQSSFSFYSAQPNQSYTNSKKKLFFTTLITLKQKNILVGFVSKNGSESQPAHLLSI